MGRRAKNKQSDPEPFSVVQENAERPSQKKLGKRKAEEVETPAKRPLKKAKDDDGRPMKPAKTSFTKGKEKSISKGEAKVKSAKSQTKSSKKIELVNEDDGAGSNEGWEDVEDDEDFKAHAKYVMPAWNFYSQALSLRSLGHYSMAATRKTSLAT